MDRLTGGMIVDTVKFGLVGELESIRNKYGRGRIGGNRDAQQSVKRYQYRLSLPLTYAIAEGSSSYGSKRDSCQAEAWRPTSTSKRAVGRAVSAVESSGVVFNLLPTSRIYFHGGWANGGEQGKVRRRSISVI